MNEGWSSPAYHIIAVPFEKIVPNAYNPNSVAPPEMKLLYLSILEDGYTQPIVCYYVTAKDGIRHRGWIPSLAYHEGTSGYL